ncbi:MAG: hypothetical protein ILA02_04605 [Clostridia bacterium]|nr:hypothetical protein [Clostridia bacterium]
MYTEENYGKCIKSFTNGWWSSTRNAYNNVISLFMGKIFRILYK